MTDNFQLFLLVSELAIFLIIVFAFSRLYHIYCRFQSKAVLYTFSSVLIIWALNSGLRIIEICDSGFDDIIARTVLGVLKAILMLEFLIYLLKAVEKYL